MATMWHGIFLFVLAVLAVNAVAGRWPAGAQRMTARETQTCDSRKTPGPICESCDLLATCVKHSNGWVNIPLENCDTQNGFYCNSRLGVCSNLTGPCHPFGIEGNFPCSSLGVFPDPYDCQKYHMCYFVDSTLVSGTVDCGSDKAFNPATGQCSLTLQDSVCQQRQFNCRNVGDAHPWPNNPNIFYVCKATTNQDERVLYPSLYRCADGEIFDGYYCKQPVPDNWPPPITGNPSGPGFSTATEWHQNNTTPIIPAPLTPSSTSTASTSSSAATSTATATATATSSSGSSTTTQGTLTKCTTLGLFPDAENCHYYYYCSAMNGAIKHMQCPDGTFYNSKLSSCTVGVC